jgi:hypothetical protein
MLGDYIDVSAVSKTEAVKLTAENQKGVVWPWGVYVIMDDRRSVLQSRAEVNELIQELIAAAKYCNLEEA